MYGARRESEITAQTDINFALSQRTYRSEEEYEASRALRREFVECNAMSIHQPEPRKYVMVDAVEARIHKTTFNDSRTAILFSITDDEWKATYVFLETLSPAMQNNFNWAMNNPPVAGPFGLFRPQGPQTAPSIRLSAGPALSAGVYLSKPLRVDEFVPPARVTSAVLTKPFSRGQVLRMDLRVQVATGDWEEFPLFLVSAKPRELPYGLERGTVTLSRVALVAP